MKSITETVYDFVSKCDLLQGRRLGLNCLGAELGSCSLYNAESEQQVRRYTDGAELKRAELIFAVRGRTARSVRENLNGLKMYEGVRSWLKEKSAVGELPAPIIDLRITETGFVEAAGTADGSYRLKLEVWYL